MQLIPAFFRLASPNMGLLVFRVKRILVDFVVCCPADSSHVKDTSQAARVQKKFSLREERAEKAGGAPLNERG